MATPSYKVWINRLHIENYKSIVNATIDFTSGLNIIIGKNGAGKTNLLDFVFTNFRVDRYIITRTRRTLKNNFTMFFSVKMLDNQKISIVEIEHSRTLIVGEDQKPKSSNIFKVKRSHDEKEEFSMEFQTGIIPYELQNNLEKNDKVRKEVFNELNFLRHINSAYVKFQLPTTSNLEWLALPASLELDAQAGVRFSEDSIFTFLFNFQMQLEESLLANYTRINSNDLDTLDNMKQFIIQKFHECSHNINIITPIRTYTPIDDIRLNPNVNIHKQDEKFIVENLIIDFYVNDSWIPWSYISDGTKRLFNLIIQTALIEDGIILIEEPELGIHPTQLYKLMDFIKVKAFTNQVLVSTHSPLVMDILKPEDLNCITIAKMSKNGSKFIKLSEQKIHKAQRYISDVGDLSQFWLHSDLEDD